MDSGHFPEAMDHNEHPREGCIREAKEEFGIDVELIDDAPVVSQKYSTGMAYHLSHLLTRAKATQQLKK